MEAVEQIKVKLSAFTYLDECFESLCLIISSPFFICMPFSPKASGREESFPLFLLTVTLIALTLVPLQLLYPHSCLSLCGSLPYTFCPFALVLHISVCSLLLLSLTMFYAYEALATCVQKCVCAPVYKGSLLMPFLLPSFMDFVVLAKTTCAC